MKRFVCFLMAMAWVLSCGEKDESETPDSETPENSGSLSLGVLEEIPYAVEAVLELEGDSDTETFNNPSGSLDISVSLTQDSEDTGVSLGESTKSDFYDNVTDASYGSCEMVNRLRGLLHEAARSDAALCDFGSLFGSEGFPDNLANGESQIVTVTEEGEEVEKYKIKITKENDKVTEFEFHVCDEGTQNLYLKKMIDADKNVSIYSKASASDNNGPNNITYYSKTEVSGKVDESGNFVGLKDITLTYSNDFKSDGSDVSYNKYKLVQSAENLALNGYATQTSADFDTLLLSFFELVDSNATDSLYNLRKLAVGAGAIIYDRDSGVKEQGWNPSGAIDASSQWIPKISGKDSDFATPPASSSDQEDLTFSGDEVWDCSGDAALTIRDEDLDFGEDDEPCEGFTLPQDQSFYLECSTYDN